MNEGTCDLQNKSVKYCNSQWVLYTIIKIIFFSLIHTLTKYIISNEQSNSTINFVLRCKILFINLNKIESNLKSITCHKLSHAIINIYIACLIIKIYYL